MSDLVAIAYADQEAVERAHKNLRKAAADGVIKVEDVVVLNRDQDGSLGIREGSTGISATTVSGGIAGGMIGAVLLAPLLGMAVGAVGGHAIWKSMFGDSGAAESFVEEISEHLAPGGSALIVLVRELDTEEVVSRVKEAGHVIKTTLGPGVEARLDAALRTAEAE
jgi:uncharacterized membrane protein